MECNITYGTDNLPANFMVVLRLFCRVMGKHASNGRRVLITLTFEVTVHIGDADHRIDPCAKFIGLRVLKIWHTFRLSINRPTEFIFPAIFTVCSKTLSVLLRTVMLPVAKF